jgi:hypothetical protein
MLHEYVTLPGGRVEAVDVAFELETLKSLRRTRQVFTAQEAEATYDVQMEGFEWTPENWRTDVNGNIRTPNGVFLAQTKRIS